MPECMFKVRKSSKYSALYQGQHIDVFVSEYAFIPTRFGPRPRKNEAVIMTQVENAWGDYAAWSGYISGGKEDGAPVYANVPKQALCMDGFEGHIPGHRPGGPTVAIGFLKRVGRDWSVVQQYETPGHVMNFATKREMKQTFIVRDGRIEIENEDVQS